MIYPLAYAQSTNIRARTFPLARPYIGLYMPSGLWRELDNFSSGSICLVLASTVYNEDDYIRGYSKYLNYKSI